MAISFSGLNSGLDTSSWISSLTALKQAKVTKLEQQQSAIQTSLQALNGIKAYFSNFRSMITKIADVNTRMNTSVSAINDIFSKHVALSSNAKVLTASATNEAAEGTYNIKVNKLATNTKATSQVYQDRTYEKEVKVTKDTQLKKLGVRAGSVDVAPDETGITVRLGISEDETIASFMDKLKSIGVNSSFNEKTSVINVDLSTADINDIGGTNIKSALKLQNVNIGYNTENLTYQVEEYAPEFATGATKLSDLGIYEGDLSIKTNDSTYSLTLESGDSIQDVIDALRSMGIQSSINNGVFRIENARVVDDGTTNFMNALGLSNYTAEVAGNTQLSDALSYTTTITTTTNASGSTQLSLLGVQDGTVTVRKDGVDYEFEIDSENDLQSFIDQLAERTITASITDGVFSIQDAEITDDGTTNMLNALFMNRPEVDSVHQTGGVLCYTTTVTTTNMADGSTTLGTYGVEEGDFVVNSGGNNYTISVTSSMTFDDLVQAFRDENLDASFANGVLDIGNVSIVASSTTTNLVSQLGIGAGDVSYMIQRSNALRYSATVTNTAVATETTTLGELGVSAGDIVVESYDNNGNIMTNTISIDTSTTIQQLINSFRDINSFASIDNGVLVLPNANIIDEGTTNIKSALGISDTRVASNIQKSEALLYTTIETHTTTANSTTTLDYLGVSSGEIVLSDKTQTYTISVDSSDTLGDFISQINDIEGFSASLENGDINLSGMDIISDGGTNLISALGLTPSVRDAISHYQSSNPLQYSTVEVHTTTADATTTLAKICNRSGFNSGTIVVNDRDKSVSITINSTDTIESVLDKFRSNLDGVRATVNDGVITIEGVNITDEGGTNISDFFGFSEVAEGYHAWSDTLTFFSVTVENTTVLATTTFNTMDGAEDLSDGNFVIADRHSTHTIEFTTTETFADFINDLNALDGISASLNNGVLQINGVSIVSDTTGLTEVLGLDGVQATVGIFTTGSMLYETTTISADTTLGSLAGLEDGNLIIEDKYGANHTVAVDTTWTFSDLVAAINLHDELSASLTDGVLSLSGGNIVSDASGLQSVLGLSNGSISGVYVTGDPMQYTSTTATTTYVTESTQLCDINDAEITDGNFVVEDKNGLHTISVTSTETYRDFIDDLNALSGVSAGLSADGRLTISGCSIVSDTTGIQSALGLDNSVTTINVFSTGSALQYNSVTYTTTTVDYTTQFSNVEGATAENLHSGSIVVTDSEGTHTIAFDRTETYGDLINDLNALEGVSASLSAGVLSITGVNDIDFGETGLDTLLGLDTSATVGVYATGESMQYNSVTYTTTTVDYTTQFSNVEGATAENLHSGSIVVTDSEGTHTIAFDRTETYGDLINDLNALEGVSASLSAGVLSITGVNDIDFGETGLDTLLGIAQGAMTGVYTDGEVQQYSSVTYTTTTAGSTSRFCDLIGAGEAGLSDGTITITSTGGVDEIEFDTTMTYQDLIDDINEIEGVTASIVNGSLVITGATAIDFGTTELDTLLGFTVTGGEPGAPVTTGVSQTSSSAVNYTQSNTAESSATMAQLGIEIGDTLQIRDNSGDVIWSVTADAAFLDTTLGDVLDLLESNGFDTAEINNGVISLTSAEHNYITGTIAEKFGIGVLSEGSTVTLGGTQTSSAAVTHTESYTADGSATMGELGITLGDTLQIRNNSGAVIWSTTADAAFLNTNLSDVLDMLESNGIDSASITDGVISLSSAANNYVTGTVADKLGIDVLEGAILTTVGASQSSSVAIMCTTTTVANTGTTFEEMGIDTSEAIAVYDKYGTLKGYVTMTSSSTISNLLSSINAVNTSAGASMTNGVIRLSNGYITGSVAEAMGLTLGNAGTMPLREGIAGTVQSTFLVRTTNYVGASSSTKLASIGVTSTSYITIHKSSTNTDRVITIANTATITNLINSINSASSNAITASYANYTFKIVQTEDDYIVGMSDQLAQKLNIPVGHDATWVETAREGIAGSISNNYGIQESYAVTITGTTTASSGTVTTPTGFMQAVTTIQAQVTVTDASSLADAITNYTTIGIANAEVLYAFKTYVNSQRNWSVCTGKTIVLTDDIDLSAYSSGEGWKAIGEAYSGATQSKFNGTFDGNGHTISNLTIYDTVGVGSNSEAGLFGGLGSSAVIRNVALTDCNINSGEQKVGGICASANSGNITNCYVTGTITSRSCLYAGGICGSSGGNITNCYFDGTITVPSGDTANAMANVGGICGDYTVSSNGIANCKTSGTITSTITNYNIEQRIGGIVGSIMLYNSRTGVKSCGVNMTIDASCPNINNYHVGKIVGEVDYDSGTIISGCTYDSTMSSSGLSDVGYIDNIQTRSATASSKLGSIGATGTSYITVHSSATGSDVVITIADTATIGNLISSIQSATSNAISATVGGGCLTINQTKTNYIVGMSDNLANALNIASYLGYDNSYTMGLFTLRSSSTSSLRAYYDTSIASTATFGTIGVSSGSFTLNDGTTVSVSSTDTILSAFTNAGLTASISNGVLTVTGDASHYITSMSDGLKSALHIQTGEGYTYNYSDEPVTMAVNQTSASPVIYYSSTAAVAGTTFAEIGVDTSEAISVYNQYGTLMGTVTMTSESTIGDMLASINAVNTSASATMTDGVISIASGYVTGEIAEALGLDYAAASTIPVRNGVAGTIQSTATVTTTRGATATTSSRLSTLGVTGKTYITIHKSSTDTDVVITLTSTKTISNLVSSIQAASSNAITATFTSGKLKIVQTADDYIVGMTSTLADKLKISTKIGEGQTYNNGTVTTYASGTSDTIYPKSTLTGSTTLGDVGLDSASFVMNDGTTVSLTSTSTILDAFTGAGLIATANEGGISLVGNSSNYIISMSDNLSSILRIHTGEGATYNIVDGNPVASGFGDGLTVTEGSGIDFINPITTLGAEVTVTDAASLATAISTYSTIGIANADVLAALATIVNAGTKCTDKTFVLTSDIDLSGYSAGEGWSPIGKDWDHRFEGTFDGNGHIVSNLTINRSGVAMQGLFGELNNGTIRNIGIVDCDITVTDAYSTGAVLGHLNSGTVTNCYVTGTISGDSSTGAVVGESYGDITDCCAAATVTGGLYNVHDIVGMDDGYTNNCYTTVNNVTTLGSTDTTALTDLAGVSNGDKVVLQSLDGSGNIATFTVTDTNTIGDFRDWLTSHSVTVCADYTADSTSYSYASREGHLADLSGGLVSAMFANSSITGGEIASGTGDIISTATVSATDTTALTDLAGVSNGDTVVLKTLDGTSNIATFTVTNTNTIGDFRDWLNSHTVAVSTTDTGSGIQYTYSSNAAQVADLSGGLADLLFGETTITGGTVHTNTDSNAQTVSTTTTLTNSTTLGDLGLNSASFVMNDGTTVSLTSTTTIASAFTNAGLTANVSNGSITVTGDSDHYITSMSSNLEDLLNIQAGEGYTYSISSDPVTAGASQTSSGAVTHSYTHTVTGSETMSQLGITLGDTLQIRDNSEAVIWSTTADAAFLNTSLDDVLDMLESNGIDTASITNGVISLTSASNNYITGTVADKLGIGVNTAGSNSTAAITQTSSSAVTYVTVSVATTGTTFAELGISTSQAISVYDVNGNLKGTVTMTSSKTLGQMLASINAVNTSAGASISNGVITIGSGYITGSIADDMGLTFSTTGTVNGTKTGINCTIQSNRTLMDGNGSVATGSTKWCSINDGHTYGSFSNVYITVHNSSTNRDVSMTITIYGTLDGIANSIKAASSNAINASYTAGQFKIIQTENDYIVGMSPRLAEILGIEVGYGSTWTCDSRAGTICTITTGRLTYKTTYTPTGTTASSGTVTAPTGFMDAVTTVAAQVTITNAASLADAISNYTTIGVANADVLAALATIVNSGTHCRGITFVLTNDIDLSGYSAGTGWTPIGSSSSNPFAGNFNGNGHVISNLTINNPDADYQGLFGDKAPGSGGTITASTVKNLGIENCNITGKNYVGGIAGSCNMVKMENCYVTGNVSGNSNVSGITGYIATSSSYIRKSYVSANVSGTSGKVGGIIGEASSGDTVVASCTVCGTVSSTSGEVGGIIGYMTSSARYGINSCKVNATITGSENNYGKFIGVAQYSSYGYLTNCTYSTSMNSSIKDIGKITGTVSTLAATTSTKLATLGVTGTSYITIHKSSTNSDIVITLANTKTVGNLCNSIKNATSNAITVNISSTGYITIKQTNTDDYIVGMSNELAAVFGMGDYSGGGKCVGYGQTWNLGKVYTYEANGSDTLGTSRTHTLAAGSTLGDIGLSSASFVMNDGTTVSLTSTSTICSAFTNAGLTANVSNGTITVTGDSSHYITSMSENLRTALHINAGAGYTYTITNDVTHANTNSNTQSVSGTNTLTNASTLGDFGLNNASFVMNDGTTVTLTSTSTILNAFTGAGLTASISNGSITVTGDSSHYITSMSSNLEDLLNIQAGEDYTYNITGGIVHSNTDSNAQTVSTTTTLTNSTTLGDLGLDSASFVMNDGTTVTLTSTTTIASAFTNAGLTANVSNGSITVTGDESHYITSMSSNLENLLHIQAGEGYTYDVEEGEVTSRIYTSEFMQSVTDDGGAYYSANDYTKLTDLGLEGMSGIIRDNEGNALHTFTVSATSTATVGDLCSLLSEYQITVNMTPTESGTQFSYRSSSNYFDGEIAEALFGENNFRYNYTQSEAMQAITNDGGLDYNMTDSTRLIDLDGASNGDKIVVKSLDGFSIYSTFTVDATSTVGDLRSWLASNYITVTSESTASGTVYSLKSNSRTVEDLSGTIAQSLFGTVNSEYTLSHDDAMQTVSNDGGVNYSASDSTKLTDIGCTEGGTIVASDLNGSTNYSTFTITSTSTVGDLRSWMSANSITVTPTSTEDGTVYSYESSSIRISGGDSDGEDALSTIFGDHVVSGLTMVSDSQQTTLSSTDTYNAGNTVKLIDLGITENGVVDFKDYGGNTLGSFTVTSANTVGDFRDWLLTQGVTLNAAETGSGTVYSYVSNSGLLEDRIGGNLVSTMLDNQNAVHNINSDVTEVTYGAGELNHRFNDGVCLTNLGVTNGTTAIIKDLNGDNEYSTFTVTNTATVADLKLWMRDNGLTLNVDTTNAGAVFSYESGNKQVVNGAGGNLTDVLFGEETNYTFSIASQENRMTYSTPGTHDVNWDTKLKDLKYGESALDITDGTVTIKNLATDASTVITIDTESTLGDLRAQLAAQGITLVRNVADNGDISIEYETDGVQIIDGTSNLASTLFNNSLTTYDLTSEQVDKLFTETMTYDAGLDTAIGYTSYTYGPDNDFTTSSSGLGCTGGNYVVMQNGVAHTLSVSATNTVADINAQIASYGLTITTESTAEGTRFIINSNTDAYLQTAGGPDASDFVTKLFGNNKTTIYDYNVHKDILFEEPMTYNVTGANKLTELQEYVINNPDGTTTTTSVGITSTHITEGIYDIVNSDGTRVTKTITSETTIDEFLGTLRDAGFSAELLSEDGYAKIRVTGSGDQYIANSISEGEKSNVVSALFGDNKATTYNYSNELDMSTSSTQTFNIDSTTELSTVGITEGRFTIIHNGRSITANVTEGMTFGDLDALLSDYDINMSLVRDENGVHIVLESYGESYLRESAGEGISNIITRTGLATVGTQYDYSSDQMNVTNSATSTVSATETMLMRDFGITTGQYYVVSNGERHSLNISSDETFGSFLNTIRSYGINASLVEREDGIYFDLNTLGDSYLESSTAPGASNVVDVLASDTVKLYDYNTNLIETNSYDTTMSASTSALLSDFGITSGQYYIYSNGVRITANISNDETFGSLSNTLASFGIRSSLIQDGDEVKLIVHSDGNSYIAKSNAANSSNIMDHIFTDDKDTMYNYETTITIDRTITHTVTATEETLISEFDTPSLKSAGKLSLTVNGKQAAIQISADETFGSLITKFAQLGIDATISPDGRFTINSKYDNVSINAAGTTSNIVTNLGLTYTDLGGYCASSVSLTYTETITATETLSVANYADLNTKLGTLNITSGLLSLFRNGVKANIQIDSNETFDQLKTRINNAFTQHDVDIRFTEDGKLEIFTDTPDVKIEAGTTTDSSNFYAICGLTSEGNMVTSSRQLYKVNGASKLMTNGLFRTGDVLGYGDSGNYTFTIGNAVLSINENTTLNDLITMINTSDDANATAYWDSVDGKLVLKSRTTGYSMVNIEAGSSNLTDILGLTATERDGSGAILSTRLISEVQELGQNAEFEINGTNYTSSSNHVQSDVSRLNGITIDLNSAAPDEIITLTVEKDVENISNCLSEIVDSYNELIENVDEELSKTGNLSNQSALKMLRNQLRSMMTSSIASAGVYKNLSQIGISVDAATAGNISTSGINRLTYNADKFKDAFIADSTAVKQLLAGTQDYEGIFASMDRILDTALTYSSGYFSSAANAYNNQLQTLSEKIARANTSVERYKQQLEKKFGSMDILIGQIKQQYQSFLTT